MFSNLVVAPKNCPKRVITNMGSAMCLDRQNEQKKPLLTHYNEIDYTSCDQANISLFEVQSEHTIMIIRFELTQKTD